MVVGAVVVERGLVVLQIGVEGGLGMIVSAVRAAGEKRNYA